MRWKVREVAESLGYCNALELSREADIPVASMYPIWQGRAKFVSLKTLDKLCSALDVRLGLLLDIDEKSKSE